jgi:DNA modification methylase
MAGSFSTVIIAILKGRNAIGVDIEKRYADWGREALLKTKDIFARLVAELRENPPLEGWCECEDGSENL